MRTITQSAFPKTFVPTQLHRCQLELGFRTRPAHVHLRWFIRLRTLLLDSKGHRRNLPTMEAGEKLLPDATKNASTPEKLAPSSCGPEDEEIDLWLLEDSLAKTWWERMKANDDALRFAEALREGIEKRNAKSE